MCFMNKIFLLKQQFRHLRVCERRYVELSLVSDVVYVGLGSGLPGIRILY